MATIPEPKKRVIPELIRQFAEEASFQWIVRERAVRSPDHALEDMEALEERIEAQVDALRVSGDPGWEIAQEELSWKEPGEIFTAALLAFESGDEDRVAVVADAAAAAPGLPPALIGALAWMSWDKAKPWAESLAASETPVLRYAAAGAAAAHRQWLPDLMAAALKDADPLVLARALKACGELGRMDSLPAVEAHLSSKHEACRFRAHWSSLLLGRKASLAPMLEWVKHPGPFRLPALSLGLRALPLAEALAVIGALPKTETRLRLQCLGWIGAASQIPWILKQCAKPALARPAGAALTWITGVQFRSGELGVIPDPGLEDELEDAGLVEPGDSDWNWPDAGKTETWWNGVAAKFPADKAFAYGRLKGEQAFKDMLIEGRQCHRLGAALELALLRPGKPMLECRALARRQNRVNPQNPVSLPGSK
jgi:uncharacterized protein (TIGR02270 family)